MSTSHDGTSANSESRLEPPIDWESVVGKYELDELYGLYYHDPSFTRWYLTLISDRRVIGTVGQDFAKAKAAMKNEVERKRLEENSSETR